MRLRNLKTGSPQTDAGRRLGFSVIELLIATTIAMVILLVVTKWFRDLSQATSRTRALVEMSGQMRAVISQLENDLRGATFPRGAAPASIAQMGYIQYVEGMASDAIPDWNIAAAVPSSLEVSVPNSLAIAAASDPVIIPAAGGMTHFSNILGAPTGSALSRFGDLDDVLSLTSRSIETPYRGKMLVRTSALLPAPPAPPAVAIQAIESPMAEIVWWVEGFDENGDTAISEIERRLHRRVFLIRPDLTNAVNAAWHTLIDPPAAGGYQIPAAQALEIMLQTCDVSFTIDPGTGNAVANSLADLSYPANLPAAPRCRRMTGGLPTRSVLNSLAFQKVLNAPAVANSIGVSRYGEDVMLSSVAGFDIRAFDPTAPLWRHAASNSVLVPGDPAYRATAGAAPQAGVGAFVDLCYANVRNPATLGTGSSWFSGPPSEFSGFFQPASGGGSYSVLMTAFDTWAPLANDTFDGVDDVLYGGGGVIDDQEELMREMAPGPNKQFVGPPYPYPLRALQITLRAYDPDSRQIRQMKASAAYTND